MDNRRLILMTLLSPNLGILHRKVGLYSGYPDMEDVTKDVVTVYNDVFRDHIDNSYANSNIYSTLNSPGLCSTLFLYSNIYSVKIEDEVTLLLTCIPLKCIEEE